MFGQLGRTLAELSWAMGFGYSSDFWSPSMKAFQWPCQLVIKVASDKWDFNSIIICGPVSQFYNFHCPVIVWNTTWRQNYCRWAWQNKRWVSAEFHHALPEQWPGICRVIKRSLNTRIRLGISSSTVANCIALLEQWNQASVGSLKDYKRHLAAALTHQPKQLNKLCWWCEYS